MSERSACPLGMVGRREEIHKPRDMHGEMQLCLGEGSCRDYRGVRLEEVLDLKTDFRSGFAGETSKGVQSWLR